MIEPILFFTQRTQAPANRNARSKQLIMVANSSTCVFRLCKRLRCVRCMRCGACVAYVWKMETGLQLRDLRLRTFVFCLSNFLAFVACLAHFLFCLRTFTHARPCVRLNGNHAYKSYFKSVLIVTLEFKLSTVRYNSVIYIYTILI